ncbi:hypothetical protein ABW20_dc0105418 [Dactylellina cionopaga]|nr:hypothetical protein ABW20_dc0105418 [Dactylellina cionopaga]
MPIYTETSLNSVLPVYTETMLLADAYRIPEILPPIPRDEVSLKNNDAAESDSSTIEAIGVDLSEPRRDASWLPAYFFELESINHNSALHDAIRRGDLGAVSDLMENGADIYQENINTTEPPVSAVAQAVRCRQMEIMSLFLVHDPSCYSLALMECLMCDDDCIEFRKFIIRRHRQCTLQKEIFRNESNRINKYKDDDSTFESDISCGSRASNMSHAINPSTGSSLSSDNEDDEDDQVDQAEAKLKAMHFELMLLALDSSWEHRPATGLDTRGSSTPHAKKTRRSGNSVQAVYLHKELNSRKRRKKVANALEEDSDDDEDNGDRRNGEKENDNPQEKPKLENRFACGFAKGDPANYPQCLYISRATFDGYK